MDRKMNRNEITEYIQRCADVMTEYNIQPEERWVVMPPYMRHFMIHSGTAAGLIFLLREEAVKLKLRGGARKAYVRSRRKD